MFPAGSRLFISQNEEPAKSRRPHNTRSHNSTQPHTTDHTSITSRRCWLRRREQAAQGENSCRAEARVREGPGTTRTRPRSRSRSRTHLSSCTHICTQTNSHLHNPGHNRYDESAKMMWLIQHLMTLRRKLAPPGIWMIWMRRFGSCCDV